MTTNANSVRIHTDGACKGNPGPGGFAAIIERDGDELHVTGGDPATNNNRMEMAAVIEVLRAINGVESLQDARITVRTDSQHVTKAFNQGWIAAWQRNGWRNTKGKAVANRELWLELLEQAGDRSISWEWVKGHAGDPMNEQCDRLAVEQAEIAGTEPEYWVSAGMPKSRAYGRTPQPTREEGPVKDAENGEAMMVLKTVFAIAQECDDFGAFRQKLLELARSVEW